MDSLGAQIYANGGLPTYGLVFNISQTQIKLFAKIQSLKLMHCNSPLILPRCRHIHVHEFLTNQNRRNLPGLDFLGFEFSLFVSDCCDLFILIFIKIILF